MLLKQYISYTIFKVKQQDLKLKTTVLQTAASILLAGIHRFNISLSQYDQISWQHFF
jgi:hypothetical protein